MFTKICAEFLNHDNWFIPVFSALSTDRERGLHERSFRAGTSLPVKMSWIDVPLKKSCDDPTPVMEKWPILLPADFAA